MHPSLQLLKSPLLVREETSAFCNEFFPVIVNVFIVMVVAVGLVVKVADGAIASASSHPPF